MTQTDLTWPLYSKVPILGVPIVPVVGLLGSIFQTSQTTDIEMKAEGAVGESVAAPPGDNAEIMMKGSATAASCGSVRVAAGFSSSDTSRGGDRAVAMAMLAPKPRINQGLPCPN